MSHHHIDKGRRLENQLADVRSSTAEMADEMVSTVADTGRGEVTFTRESRVVGLLIPKVGSKP